MSEEVRMTVWPGKRAKPLGAPFPPPPVELQHDPFLDAPPKVEHFEGGARLDESEPKMAGLDPRTKYQGLVAENYDDKREEQPRWHEEQKIIEEMLDRYPPGTKVLDVPVGTGRFIQHYVKRKFVVVGVDISLDMLKKAEAKLEPGSVDCRLYQGDIKEVDKEFPPGFFDVSVMCRLTRWLSPEECAEVIQKLAAITRQRIIFTARVANHPHERPEHIFMNAIPEWWICASMQVASDPDYRVIAMEPKEPIAAPMVDPFADQMS
jgi:SAM-dependent methyltransferase